MIVSHTPMFTKTGERQRREEKRKGGFLRPVGRDSTTARILDFGVVSFATKTCDLENCLSHGEEKAPVA